MNILEQILKNFPNSEFTKVDYYDDAVVGVDSNGEKLIYDVSKMLDIMVERDELNEDEAIDHFEYNISRSILYVENAPILMYTYFF